MPNKIDTCFDELSALNKELLSLAGRVAKADEGNVFAVDLMTMAVVNRALELSEGFKLLVKNEHFLCAAPLLRLQLDNLLRYSAVWLVEKPHDFCMEVFKGTPIKKLKDASGKKMMDYYLVEKLSNEIKWIKSVYEKTCGYVHFSEEHFHKIITSADDDGSFSMGVAGYSKPVPESAMIEAAEAFNAATMELMKYVYGWLKKKDGNIDDTAHTKKN